MTPRRSADEVKAELDRIIAVYRRAVVDATDDTARAKLRSEAITAIRALGYEAHDAVRWLAPKGRGRQ